MPLVQHPNWQLVKVNLFNSKTIVKDGSEFKVYVNKWFREYVARDIGKASLALTFLQEMSFFQFVRHFHISKGCCIERKIDANKRIVVDWTPKLYCAPNKRDRFKLFLEMELIKYRPWHHSKEEAYNGAKQLHVEAQLQSMLREHRKEQPLSNVHDLKDCPDEEPSDTISLEQLFAFYSIFMNSDWAKGKDSHGRPNVPEVVRKQVLYCRIKLEPDEVEEAVSVDGDADLYGQISDADIDIEGVQDVVIPDDNLTHDWQQDANEYAAHIGEMTSQINVLRESTARNDIELRVTNALNPDQQHAFDIISSHHNSNSSKQLLMGIFGGPGTGKSVCINRTHHMLQHLAATMGLTGKVAYMNNGETIHSFLSIPCQGVLPHKGIKNSPGKLRKLQEKLQGVKYIIVDEISMIGHRLFAWMDVHLKVGTGKEDEPFGGMNMIVVGDFAQLPPVLDTSLFRAPYEDKDGKHGLLQGHLLYKEHFKTIVFLQYNQRQIGEDAVQKKFKSFLRRVRIGKCTSADYKYIQTRMISNVSDAERSTFTDAPRIYAKNAPARRWNAIQLELLKEKEHAPIIRIDAQHSPNKSAARNGTFRNFSVDKTLYLAKGARVSLTVNRCTKRGLTNGASGTVVAIIYGKDIAPPALPRCVIVQFDHLKNTDIACIPGYPGSVAITPYAARWKSYVRNQIPLILSWAITIHKSQGMTLPKVVIDTGRATFAPGILYTALSRVKSFSDILISDFEEDYLTTRLARSDVISLRIAEDIRLLQLHKATKAQYERDIGAQCVAEQMDIDSDEQGIDWID